MQKREFCREKDENGVAGKLFLWYNDRWINVAHCAVTTLILL